MRPSDFRWIEWNIEHATKHGCTIVEIERVVRNNDARAIGHEKWMSTGRGQGDRLVQVAFLLDDDSGDTAFVIHAMPLTTRRRRRHR